MSSLRAAVRADHEALSASQRKYDLRDGAGATPLVISLVTNVGFQQLAAFRVAQALHRRGLTPLAMIVSRLIRHLYGAEMHWATNVAPGIVLVHGNGIVLSREATVGSGVVISQHVTLGISTGPNRTSGAPTIKDGVHLGPGSVLVGPITIGENCKVAANSAVSSDIPPWSIVMSSPVDIRSRARQIST